MCWKRNDFRLDPQNLQTHVTVKMDIARLKVYLEIYQSFSTAKLLFGSPKKTRDIYL